MREMHASLMNDQVTLDRVRAALSSDDPILRSEAVDALSIIGDVTGLLRGAVSNNSYVRVRALRSLKDAPGIGPLAVIVRASFADAREIREAAAVAMTGRRGYVVRPFLARLACDQDSVVRFRALTALAPTRGTLSRIVLDRAARSDPEPWLRQTAVKLATPPAVVPVNDLSSPCFDEPV